MIRRNTATVMMLMAVSAILISISACSSKDETSTQKSDSPPAVHDGTTFISSLNMGKDVYPDSAEVVLKIEDLLAENGPLSNPESRVSFGFLGLEPKVMGRSFMNTYWRKPVPGEASYYAFKGVDIPDGQKTVNVVDELASVFVGKTEIGVRILKYSGWVNSLNPLQLLNYQFTDDAKNPDNNWVNTEQLLLDGAPAVFEQFISVDKHGPTGAMGSAWINTCITRLSVAKNGQVYQAFARETDEYQDGNTQTYTAKFLPASTISKLFATLKIE